LAYAITFNVLIFPGVEDVAARLEIGKNFISQTIITTVVNKKTMDLEKDASTSRQVHINIGATSAIEVPSPAARIQEFPFWRRPRLLYTTVFVWLSVTGGRFMATFLEQEASLSPVAIGSLFAIQDATSVIASSFAGVFADWMEQRYPKRGRRWVVAMGSCFGSACFCLHGCNRIFPSARFFTSFPWYMILRILYSISTCLVSPVVDGMCLDFLKRHATTEEYGKERLFGAISWAITHLMMGPIIDRYHDFGIFYFFGIAAAVAMLIVTQVQLGNNDNHPQSHPYVKRRTSNIALPTDDEGILNDHITQSVCVSNSSTQTRHKNLQFISVFALFGSSCYTITFLIARVTLASGQAVVDKMVFLFFEYLGSSFTLMSLTVVLTVIFEIPIFHVAPTILKRIGSSGMLLLASFAYITRVIGYTLVPAGKTPLVLLLEPLHGVTFACSQSAGVDFASKLIHEQGLEASSQGFLQFFVRTGSAVGLLFGGFMEQHYGPKEMYRVSSVVVFVGSLTFVGCIIQKHTATYQQMNRIRHHVLPQDDQDNGLVELTISPNKS
jgi:Na+/melibiose symporter-like transporter